MTFATGSPGILASLRLIKRILEEEYKDVMLSCTLGSYFPGSISNTCGITTSEFSYAERKNGEIGVTIAGPLGGSVGQEADS